MQHVLDGLRVQSYDVPARQQLAVFGHVDGRSVQLRSGQLHQHGRHLSEVPQPGEPVRAVRREPAGDHAALVGDRRAALRPCEREPRRSRERRRIHEGVREHGLAHRHRVRRAARPRRVRPVLGRGRSDQLAAVAECVEGELHARDRPADRDRREAVVPRRQGGMDAGRVPDRQEQSVDGRSAERTSRSRSASSRRAAEATVGAEIAKDWRVDANVSILRAKYDDFQQTSGGTTVSRAATCRCRCRSGSRTCG